MEILYDINIELEINKNELRIAKILHRTKGKYLKSQEYEKATFIQDLSDICNHIHQLHISDKYLFHM